MQAAAIAMPAVSGILGGIGGMQEAQGEKIRAEANAYIGRTRAMQTNVAAREGLNDELATMKATMAANSQKAGVGTLEMFDELRSVRNRERRVEFGNRMAEAADYRQQGKNAQTRGRNALLGGLIKAGPSLFDVYDYSRKN